MDIDDIPGLAEAKAWERSARERAFLDVPWEVLGFDVLPLTLYQRGVLKAGSNAFVSGGPVTPEAVAVFLWVISPGFRADDGAGRAEFIARLRLSGRLAGLPECTRQIGAYLDEIFLDAPAATGGGRGASVVTCTEAIYVDFFADAYSWSDEKTMHTALPKLHQLMRRVALRRDPKTVFINRRSDKVRGDWQRSLPRPESIAASNSLT